MNKVELMGRLTKEVETRYTQTTNKAVTTFTLAVSRGKEETDFISCKAFGKTAELLTQYTKKGDRIIVVGSIQTGNYVNKEGNKVYTTDVIVNELYFVETKKENNEVIGEEYQDPFANIGEDTDLPF